MHTSGPWTVQVTGGAAEYVSGALLGLWATVEGPDYETRAANARLIAKAPDLRDALRWALDQIEDDLDHQAALAHARSLLED